METYEKIPKWGNSIPTVKNVKPPVNNSCCYLPKNENKINLFAKISRYTVKNNCFIQKVINYLCRMADTEMEDAELLAGRWCGHKEDSNGMRPPAPVPVPAPLIPVPAPVPPPGSMGGLSVDSPSENNNQVNANRISRTVPTGTTSHSGVSGTSYMSDQDQTAFGRGYIQCKSARIEAAISPATECSTGPDLGKKVNTGSEKVGNLNLADDPQLHKTFRGSRVTSKGEVVNQAISASFDPATLLCTTCSKEHSIIPTDESEMVIIVTDQNFVAGLSGKSSCVPVVRLEDPTLKELFDISVEILDRYSLPNGTLFLVGSTSHLCEMGSTIYSLDWIRMCKDFSARWRHVKVGPLPPVLREPSPAATTKVLTEIWSWFTKMYGTSTTFPAAAWDRVITALADNTDQNLDLASRETYRVALPISLTCSALTAHKFTISSCLPCTHAFTGETTYELLHALLLQLSSKFGCNAHPEDILAREPAEQEGMDTGNSTASSIIICGGSNCKRLATLLAERGTPVTDLTVPGWTPTTSNISKLVDELQKLEPGPDCILISDMISNVSFGFEQLNGSLALPIKSGGTYHMYGKVSTSSRESLHTVLEKLIPVFKMVPGLKLCLPPLPRYLHHPCCEGSGHCEDLNDPNYAAELLGKTIGLRKILRDFLHSRVSNVWVPDTLGDITIECTCLSTKAESLRSFFASDGVHMTPDGAQKYVEVVKNLLDERITASALVSGSGKPREFFWRGFVSPTGSSRPSNMSAVHQNRAYGGGKWRGPSAGSRTGSGSGPRPGGRGGRSYPPPPSAGRRH